MLKNGVRTAIVGLPNAGKSSLLNALAGYDRAIVTDIPGTTRDTVEETVTCGGTLLRLIDTAGIHDTADAVEQLGVERSRKAAETADLVIAVADGSQTPPALAARARMSGSTAGGVWLPVCHGDHQIGSLCRLAAALYAQLLHGVGGIVDTGGVNKPQEGAAAGDGAPPLCPVWCRGCR